MILKQFPDIEWLKKQARSNFADQKGIQGSRLPEKGWPSVVMNTRSAGTERSDIPGPFSVFLNLEGSSHIRTEGLEFSLERDTYCITNKGQHYDLIIPERSNTLTFNIHFGERLFLDTAYALRHSHKALLDEPVSDPANPYQTYPRRVWRDRWFQSWTGQLSTFYTRQDNYPVSAGREEEILSGFLEHILLSDRMELRAMQSIPSMKFSTRKELMKRVLRAVELINDRYATDVTLDDLSEISNLSKFHLQRTFRQVKGCTPQQYIASLRHRKARELLKSTRMPLTEIALATGFSELSAFSRFFLYHAKMYPSAYREKLAIRVK